MPVAEDTPEMLTVAEVAERMRVAPNTVLRWIHDGLLPAHQLPGRERTPYRIAIGDYQAFVDSLQRQR